MRPLLIACLAAMAPGAWAADFTRDVKPVLEKHCVACHGPKKQRASLRVDLAVAIREGGNAGPAVVPGKPAESMLLKAVTGQKGVQAMPPKGPRLSAAEVAVLAKWVEEGAKPPAGETVVVGRRKSGHWSFQPVKPVPVPAVKQADWPLNPIDNFLLARMEKEGIRPSGEADRVTLLRRVSLDLTGLPPAPAEVDEFVKDTRPGAYERAVGRLLASPHFGERWGRHWLDQARYADSNGYSIDSPRVIWKYRDWVIGAINSGMTFDRFTIEQLAGDLLPRATAEQKVATGFHRNTQINEEGGIDLEQFRVEAIVDRTNTTGAVWLGLTVGCCQCHDHKFDPISQKEYYRLYAFFNNSDDPKLELVSAEVQRLRKKNLAEVKALQKKLLDIDRLTDATLERWEGSISADERKKLPKNIQTVLALPPNGRTPRQLETIWAAYRRYEKLRHLQGAFAGPFEAAAQMNLLTRRNELERRIAFLKKNTPRSLTSMVVNERKVPRVTYIQLGGDFLRKGATVTSGTPEVLPELKAHREEPGGKPPRKPTRLDLAKWLVSPENPLTARVAVNRVWQQYFGVGLVETDNDFGTQGTRPTHPELLDWLAGEYVRSGWDTKALHRLIVTSRAYRQSSSARPDLRTVDPRNLLLARQNRLRLEAEVVRDVALAASGLLTREVGGPGVYPPQPGGVYSFTQVPKNWVASVGPRRYRRGMYTFFWRSAPHPNLTVFDAPDATAACTRRNRSNTPLQALTLLNDEGFVECAEALARRVRSAEGDDARLALAFRLAVSRQPTDREKAILKRFLAKQREGLSEERAWVQLGRVLLNLDETITRE